MSWWDCLYLSVADLIELRKLRKSREGIDASKLIKGDIKKKKKKVKEDEELQGGLKPGASTSHEVDECVTVYYMIGLY